MQTYKINDILNYVIERYKKCTDPAERELLETAMNNIDWSIDNSDMREDTVDKYIAADPYSWLTIPNFAELDENGDEEIAVVYENGRVVVSPLLH